MAAPTPSEPMSLGHLIISFYILISVVLALFYFLMNFITSGQNWRPLSRNKQKEMLFFCAKLSLQANLWELPHGDM